jgi:glycosyltransferase involved in cell wall biosynthesis
MVIAIYNVFDGLELLPYSLNNLLQVVDHALLVTQDVSNHGERQETYKQVAHLQSPKVSIIRYEPDLSQTPGENERLKRNFGLSWAKNRDFYLFMDVDCDEFYHPDELQQAKEWVISQKLNGLVCRSQVYFKSPVLTVGIDVTLVPIMLRVDGCTHVMNKNMPYAWSETDKVPFTQRKQIRIDPTRQVNFTTGIEWTDIIMHHYSWVRKDYGLKIRNSSARDNIQRSTVLDNLVNSKHGYYCDFYGKHLTSCPNVFGLPEWQEDQNNPDTAPTSAGSQ